MSDDRSENRWTRAAWASFVAIAALICGDLAMDSRSGVSLAHVVVEVSAALLALLGAGLLWRQLRTTTGRLRMDLSSAREDAAAWQDHSRGLMRGLGEAIDAQFEVWALTQAERGVGLLLLKGLSLKHVARVRGTSERTAREQAREIYRKGKTGRADLSAFFLEDLLLPTEERERT